MRWGVHCSRGCLWRLLGNFNSIQRPHYWLVWSNGTHLASLEGPASSPLFVSSSFETVAALDKRGLSYLKDHSLSMNCQHIKIVLRDPSPRASAFRSYAFQWWPTCFDMVSLRWFSYPAPSADFTMPHEDLLFDQAFYTTDSTILSKSPRSDAAAPAQFLMHPKGDFWPVETSSG